MDDYIKIIRHTDITENGYRRIISIPI